MADKDKIGLFAATSIGVGGMIGAGIFSIIGIAAQIAQTALPLAFFFGGMIALLSTYSFAKLSSKYPSQGGPVEFIFRSFGKGIFSGGMNVLLWVGYIFALALYARAFGGYAMSFVPEGAPAYWSHILITGIVVLFTLVNAIGAEAVGKSETTIVAIKVGILLLFIGIGAFFVDYGKIAAIGFSNSMDIVQCSAIVFIAYEGFGLVTNAAGDMKNPRETLPKALYLSVGITILIYVAIAGTVIGNLPVEKVVEAKDHALAVAAEPFLGQIGFTIVTIAALFSISSAINATLYGAANVSYIIASEGALPNNFNRKIWQTSKEGLFITAGAVILLSNLADLGNIALAGSSVFLIIYGLVNIGHLRLIEKTGANKYIVWLSILGCSFSLGFLIYRGLTQNIAIIILVVGLVIFSFLAEWLYKLFSDRGELEFNPLIKTGIDPLDEEEINNHRF